MFSTYISADCSVLRPVSDVLIGLLLAFSWAEFTDVAAGRAADGL